MAKNDQDPFGSITISPNAEKPEAGPGDFHVPIEPPAPSARKQKAAGRGPEKKSPSPAKTPERRNLERRPRPVLPLRLILPPALVLLAFFAYTLIGFLGVPYLLQSRVPAMAEKSLNRSIAFGSVSFNPFTLRLKMRNAIIGPDLRNPDDPVDPLFSAGLVEADISWSSLLRRQLNCASLVADNLFLHLVRNEEKKYNVTDILPIREDRALAGVDLPFAYFLQNITVTNSRIVFDDAPSHKTHTIERIELALPLLFHYPDRQKAARDSFAAGGAYVNPKFTALINGSPIDLTGKTKIEGETFSAQLQLHLDNVDLPAYLAYLPVQSQFRVEKGTGDILMDIIFLSGPDDRLSLEIETSGRLTDVSLLDKNNAVNLIPEATVRATLYPLLSRYAVKEIMLTDPHLRLTRQADGKWSFPGLPGPVPAAEPDQEKAPTDVVIDRWKIANARLSFVDRKVAGGYAEEIHEINFTLTDFNRSASQPAPFALEGVTSDKNKITITGEIVPSTLLTTGLVAGGPVHLQKLTGYFTGPLLSLSQGKIDRFTSRFSLAGDKNATLSLEDGDFELSDIVLAGKEGSLLAASGARFTYARLAPRARRLENGALTADGAEVFLRWDKEKRCNWALLPGQPADGKGKTWQISLSALDLPDARVHLEDHSLPTPITLETEGVQIRATDLANVTDHKGELSLRANNLGGGSLSLEGPVSLSPFSARFACELKNYGLATLPTLVTDWLNLDRIAGTLEARGEINLPNFSYSGALAVHNFSAGRETGPELVRFARAETGKLDFTLHPLAVSSAELLCDQAYLRWIIPATGPMNLATFFSRSRPGLADFTNSGQIALAAIKLTDATLDFTDQRVSPAYDAQLRLGGTVAGLANAPGNAAHLSLQSTAGHEVSGDIAFFDQTFAAEMKAGVQNMRVADFSPYLSPILGYTLQDGRFHFSTTYQQKEGTVTAANALQISGLKLGEQRGMPSSQLPLTLALLTDAQGVISLNLPVQGSIADPGYSLAGAINRALRNIVLKTAVSPFSQLQAAFPEMDQAPDHLLFAAGSAALSADHKKFLSLFARVMGERPLLTLLVKGYAGYSQDYDALLAAKKESARQHEAQQEQKKSTQMARKYGREEITAGASNQQQPPPFVPAPAVSIGKQELLQLAGQRQNAVVNFLVSDLKVDAKRVIRDSVGELVPATATGRPGARVDLKLGALLGNR
jgi:uncharacterized protein involved in outer membrane biogenesis